MFTRRIKLHGLANTIRVYTSAFMYRASIAKRDVTVVQIAIMRPAMCTSPWDISMHINSVL